MKHLLLLTILILTAVNLAIANVPAPESLEGVGIELQNDCQDYVFYFGKYTSLPENGKSVGYLEIEQITLTKEKPFVIETARDFNNIKILKEKFKDGDTFNAKRLDYLIAVKKDSDAKINPDLEKKMLTLIEQKIDEEGIYYAVIPEFGVRCNDYPTCLGIYTNVVRVESLDQNGLKFQGFDQNGYWIGKESERPKETKTISCLGVFLSLFVTLGFSFLSKSNYLRGQK